MHSHDYRSAEPFAGKSVLVLGAGLSGLDIAMELANVNAKVFHYFFHLFLHAMLLYKGMKQYVSVDSLINRLKIHVFKN